MTELYGGIIIRNCIKESCHMVILRNDITELYHGIMIRNCIVGLDCRIIYYGIISWSNITRLGYGIELRNCPTSYQRVVFVHRQHVLQLCIMCSCLHMLGIGFISKLKQITVWWPSSNRCISHGKCFYHSSGPSLYLYSSIFNDTLHW